MELNRLHTFTMPDGTLSETGMALIWRLFSEQDLSSPLWRQMNPDSHRFYLPTLPDTWQWVWLVQRGEYRGTFPKRVNQYYHKTHGLQCPKEFLSAVGNIAKAHSNEPITYTFDIVNRIDWHDGDFGDGGSCWWWPSQEYAKTMLIDNGGLAIRFYEDGQGYGRAWLVPIDDFYILFNGYGFAGDSTLTTARMFAAFMGLQYQRIHLTNNGNASGTLYINGGRGYVIGTGERIDGFTDYDFEWLDDSDYCEACGTTLYEDDVYYGPDYNHYCERCFYNRFDTCTSCGDAFDRDDITERDGEYLCPNCLKE